MLFVLGRALAHGRRTALGSVLGNAVGACALAVLVSVTVAGVIVIQDWRKIQVRSAAWLVASSLLGIPLGMLLLTRGLPGDAEPVLPSVTRDESEVGWGDEPGQRDDEWYLRERPPHHGG